MNRPSLRVVAVCLTLTGVLSVLPQLAQAYGDPGHTSGQAGNHDVLLAYIDPGVAGFVIVTVLGFVSAAGYMVRAYLGRLKRAVLGGRKGTRQDDSGGGEGRRRVR